MPEEGDAEVLIVGAGPVGLTLAIDLARDRRHRVGTCYDRSPIIAYDGAEPPPDTMSTYTLSTVPGCRTPHRWLADGASLYDAMGPEFTLLRFDPAIDVCDRAGRGEAESAPEGPRRRAAGRHSSSERAGIVTAGSTRGLARQPRAGRSACLDRPCPRRHWCPIF
jgi:NADPH-dependent 2,4-dienoyl-CoA reductase/sulfur reductase-like enzyme